MNPVGTNAIGVKQILGEMEALRRAAESGPAAGPATPAGGSDFSAALARAVDGVNGLQTEAKGLAAAFERGEQGVNLVDVMVASQKAQLAFRATSEVRNHLVRAYQDVMNMPL